MRRTEREARLAADAALLAQVHGIQRRLNEGMGRDAMDALLSDAFRDRGGDPAASSGPIGVTLRGGREPAEIAAALETWAWCRSPQGGSSEPDWRALLAAAHDLAPDPWREAFASAAVSHVPKAIRRQAAAVRPPDEDPPLATLHRLGFLLSPRGRLGCMRPRARRTEPRFRPLASDGPRRI